MSERLYWRIAFAMPLVIPLAYVGLDWLRGWISDPSEPAGLMSVILFGSLLYAGPLYVLFFLGLLSILRRKAVGAYRSFSWWAPPAFLALFLVAFQGYWLASSKGSWLDIPGTLLGYALLILVLGYTYVGMAWSARWILKSVHVLHTED
jgi:hypothetical protein